MSPETQEKLAALDAEIREKRKEIDALLRESTSHAPLESYRFVTEDGEVELSALFGDRDDLIVIHNMGAKCSYCTLWADSLNGVLEHIESRTAIVVCSPDAPDAQAKFAASRDWNFTMISDSAGSDFTAAMGYRYEHEGKSMVMPGFSTFRKHADGSVTRVAHAPFGPYDSYLGIWHMFSLLDGGADGWSPKFRYTSTTSA